MRDLVVGAIMRNATKIDVFSSLGPTAEEICRQVERILASEEFHAPKRGRNFLEFVVSETLAGRSGFLKAFTIANMVFGREASFDPQNDPVVRIEAGRIRKALERYYLVAGQADDVIITVPKGGYVPHFEYTRDAPMPARPEKDPENPRIGEFADQDHSPHEARRPPPIARGLGTGLLAILLLLALASAFLVAGSAPIRPLPTHKHTSPPTVAVEVFAESNSVDSNSDIARGLRDDVIGQLAQLEDIVVVADPPPGDHAAAADYALQGNVQTDGSRLRSVARLVRRADGAVIWANNFDADLRAQNKLWIQTNVARQIAGAIAQPHGAIFQAETAMIAQAAQKADQDARACIPAYYSYLQAMTSQSHGAVRECLQQAIRRTPDNATSWALLSLVYLDEIRFRYRLGTPSSAKPLELATASAQRAESLAPDNPRVLRAVMLVNFFRGDIDKALAAGTAAYGADPDDVEVAGEYGLRLAMSGKWQSGCELISIALDKNAGPSGYYEAGMAMCAFMRGDIEAAEQWSRISDLDGNPMRRLALLSILGAAGKMEDAKLEQDWLQSHAPALMTNIRQEVSLRLQRPADQERFFAGLRAAGVAVDLPSGG
ncbi:TolB-like protein [Rhizobium sp. BK226]|nr:TolB-like protein [Rhizobium sp. BK226]